MAKISQPGGPLAIAKGLAAEGLNVLPARHKDKAPIVEWRQYQSIRTDAMLSQWFGTTGNRNYWVMTGRMSGVIVIDCDTEAGDAWWREQLGDEVMDSAAKVATSKGTHYWFRLPEDWPEDEAGAVLSWSVHPGKSSQHNISFDVRADGTGVIAPPSVHESGHVYAWSNGGLAHAAEAPPALLDGSLRDRAPRDSGGATDDAEESGPASSTHSILARLLGQPPGGDGSGRNDWLTRVAGHYAKTYHNQEDLFKAHCLQANQMMGSPLEEKEFEKTVASVWRGEHRRNPERALDASCGWLQSGNTRVMTQVVVKDAQDGNNRFELVEYADFDLVTKGVMIEEGEVRTYWVRVRRKRRGVGDTEEFDAVLPGTTLGDDKKLRSFLAARACTVMPPTNIWPREGSIGVRMQRYLESQNPPIVKVTKTLGWDQDVVGGAGGFITHEGVITAEEVFTPEASGVLPNPQLKAGGVAAHRYGFSGDLDEAKRVLREVTTFHFDDVTAVFGAWWAACLIKPQIEARTSLFPFMAVEAPSESGKTNGFFAQMIELNGNTSGEMNPTFASLRNIAASHRNGIVWVDDLDDPANLMELLRAATSGGTMAKMGEDRESIIGATIVSPVVISGEALGLGNQKALLDRAIILKAGSPTGRTSYHDPSRPQWDDVLVLREQYPGGLADVAGWLVQEALAHAETATALLRELRTGSGRSADKLAILRVGARLLDALLAQGSGELEDAWAGNGRVARDVDAWIEAQGDSAVSASDNALTLELLPWALRKWQYPDKAFAGERAGVDTDTPAFVKNWDVSPAKAALFGERQPEILFNTDLLAEAWDRHRHGRVEKRTQTSIALTDQAVALGAKNRQIKVANAGGRRSYYRVLTGDIAIEVLRRAQGG
jgi:hypothetical protein